MPEIAARFEKKTAAPVVTFPQSAMHIDVAEPEETFMSRLNKSKGIISFAATIGGVLGGIAGSFLMPGAGTALGAAVGAGLATIIAIGVVVVLPKIIARYQKKTEKIKQEAEMIPLDVFKSNENDLSCEAMIDSSYRAMQTRMMKQSSGDRLLPPKDKEEADSLLPDQQRPRQMTLNRFNVSGDKPRLFHQAKAQPECIRPRLHRMLLQG